MSERIADNEKGDWIVTYTGKVVTPVNPDPRTLDIRDIAHALANQCRFTGHTRKYYSIAQHSVLVSNIVPKEDALWGLLHDASEAYISDIAGPVKRNAGFTKAYAEAEEKLMRAVINAFGLSADTPATIKPADLMVLRAEQRDLMPNDPNNGDIYEKTILPWGPEKAEREFLRRFEDITGEGGLFVEATKAHVPGWGFMSKKVNV